MSSAATNADGLVVPDYGSKPITTLMDVVLKAISFVDVAANGNRWLIFKSEDGIGSSDDLSELTALIKSYDPTADDDWEVAFTVMAEPNVVDKQRDMWTEEEIRKAAHQFLADGGLLNHQHQDMNSVGQLAESFVALGDMSIETPDGKTALVKKGSWVIGVKPNPEIKRKIMSGEITGMSVQGSAKRVQADQEAVKSAIEKADKDNRAIPRKAGGEGIKRAQHVLGIEESGEYDDATEQAISEWMAKKGVPGIPTLATLKLLLNDQPVAAPMAAPAAGPVSPEVQELAPVEETEKHAGQDVPGEPYNPANTSTSPEYQKPETQNGVYVGAQPGAMGLRAQDISVDSTEDDLKAALHQSVQEGNESLVAYMDEHLGGSSAGNLYGQEVNHAELWYMYSKFVSGTRPMIDANGDMQEPGAVQAAPVVEKGAWTGSHGGHDPDAKKGNMEFIVRSFGKWANGKQSVAARKLLDKGIVKTPEGANRLASWLKSQWLGSTDWQKGPRKGVKKSFDAEGLEAFDHDALVKAVCSDLGMDHADLVQKMATPEYDDVLAKLFPHEQAAEEVPTVQAQSEEPNPALGKVADILRSGGSAENVMDQIRRALENKPRGMDGAMPALKAAITEAAQADPAERDEMIESIIEDFSRYMQHANKSAVAKRAPDFSDAKSAAEETNANPTNSPIGEEMDQANIEENREHLSAAAEFITSLLGQESKGAAEVEKEAVEEEEMKEEKAPVAELPEDPAPEADGDLEAAAEEALDDEGDDVTEEELIRVLNHVVESMDTLEDRVAQLETLEKKLDQVGELAKALDVTGQIDVLNTQVSELTKALDAAVSSEEMEQVRKQLDDIASTPGAPSAIPVDEAVRPARVVEEVAKSAPVLNDAASIWNGTFR